ncbi:MAG: amidohydrolase family protein [Phycisphaerae bacterium]
MITDCHTHISCSAAQQQGLGERLAAEENVDKCIVLADNGGSPAEINEQLAQFISRHDKKMVGFALIDPTKTSITEKSINSATLKQGLKGCVLYCSEGGFHPAHTKAMRLYEIAQEMNLPVFFHNAGDLSPDAVMDYAQPYLLDEVARKFKSLKIVIGTMGMPFIQQSLYLIAKHQNVYADLTINPSRIWQVYNTVVAAHERGVLDKLLFGSGFPFGSASDCIETLLGFNKLLGEAFLPTVPRGDIRNIIERDSLKLLEIETAN